MVHCITTDLRVLTVCCDFCCCFQGEVQALFLRHEGYLGAVGAFLKGAEEEGNGKRNEDCVLKFMPGQTHVKG